MVLVDWHAGLRPRAAAIMSRTARSLRATGLCSPSLRADPTDREALLSVGHPFYSSRGGDDRIRVLLTEGTDWEAIRELVTEGYRTLAPKKLSALLDYCGGVA